MICTYSLSFLSLFITLPETGENENEGGESRKGLIFALLTDCLFSHVLFWHGRREGPECKQCLSFESDLGGGTSDITKNIVLLTPSLKFKFYKSVQGGKRGIFFSSGLILKLKLIFRTKVTSVGTYHHHIQ
jgi:hypothetical protein